MSNGSNDTMPSDLYATEDENGNRGWTRKNVQPWLNPVLYVRASRLAEIETAIKALEEIAKNHDGHQTYSGTDCRDIAEAALSVIREFNGGEA